MTETLATAVDAVRRGGRWFFGVPIREQTYRNLCYLLLAFPLGIAYFVFLVTSLTVSIALLVLLVGVPLLGFSLFAIAELAAFERFLAERLLRVEIPTSDSPGDAREWLWRLVFDRSPWVGALYLFSKFVVGIATLFALAFGTTITYSLVSAPLHYREESVGIHLADPIEFIPAISYQHDGWTLDLVSPVTLAVADGELISVYVDSIPAALLVSAIGVLTGLVTLHLFNALAWLSGRYAALLLRRTRRSAAGQLLIWGEDGGGPSRERGGDDGTPASPVEDGDGGSTFEDEMGPARGEGTGPAHGESTEPARGDDNGTGPT